MRAALFGILIGMIAVSGCSGPQPSRPAAPAGSSHLNVAATFRTFHVPSTPQSVESIVQVDPNQYLLCDFYDIYQLARGAGGGYTIKILNRPPATAWSPAGLAYRDGLVYIADNLGHDVLVVRVQGNNLVPVRRVARQDGRSMGTPRHVVAEADGSVVVADYAGNAVLRFNGDGSLAWTLPMPSAGGVIESGGFIYATSTGNHTVSKIDLHGKILRTTGSIGWSPGRYVFPIDVADAGGRLVVTDAVTGRISVLDQNLRQVGMAGGNGPGTDAMDYPYATLPVAGGYVVVDTGKDRLLFTDRGWTLQQEVVFGTSVPAGRQRPLVYGTDARPTSYGMLPGVDVVAALGLRTALPFTGGFDGLDSWSGRNFVQLNFDDQTVSVRFITWSQRVGSVILVGSPQAPWLEVIDPSTGLFSSAYVGLDTWWRAGWLLYPQNLRVDLAQVISRQLANIEAVKRLLAAGATRERAFQLAIAGDAYDWSLNVTSPQGRQFLSSGRSKADASTYYTWALQQPNIHVAELLMVKYLSGS
jgi:DNA-binding beta-propeller fold protein YncE